MPRFQRSPELFELTRGCGAVAIALGAAPLADICSPVGTSVEG